MAKVMLVTYFKTPLEDRPGALLAIAKDLKSRNLGLLGLWGFSTESGQAELYCIPKNAEKFRAAFKSAGTQIEEGTGFFMRGSDKTGALVKALQAIAKEGVNISALHALAAGGSYGSFINVAPGDVEKTAKALGVK